MTSPPLFVSRKDAWWSGVFSSAWLCSCNNSKSLTYTCLAFYHLLKVWRFLKRSYKREREVDDLFSNVTMHNLTM